MSKRKCRCTFLKGTGWVNKECAYHGKHCHFYGCRKKLKKNEHRYCKKHEEIMDRECVGLVDAFGGVILK